VVVGAIGRCKEGTSRQSSIICRSTGRTCTTALVILLLHTYVDFNRAVDGI
jgi:hypothetical protein